MIGQEVFGYRVEELIGKGSFASVYKVKKENESGTYVRALKHIVIPEQAQYQRIWNAMGRDKEKTERYFEQVFQETMQEIRLLHAFTDSGIHHIVSCYENDVICHESPRQYEIFILMEYLTPLSDYIGENDFTTEDVLNLGIQILDALEVCHKSHIIHRDVKEDNIFLTPNGVYKLGDFGVAKILSDNGLGSSMKGTSEYMAPEVLRHAGDYDETVDLYSLGVVLYRMMNHMRSPFFPTYPNDFDTGDEERALQRRLNGEPIPMPDAAPEVLGKVILKALASENQRFRCAEDFRDSLVQVKDSLSDSVLHRPVMTGEQSASGTGLRSDAEENEKKDRKRQNKRKIVFAAIMAGIFAVTVGVGYKSYHQKQMRIAMEYWEQNSVFPFATVSMEMTETDFAAYYNSRWSKGIGGQYYLELGGEQSKDYVTVMFQEDLLASVNYSFQTNEQEWIDICRSFYQDENIGSAGWPYVLQKDSAQIMLNYEDAGNRADIFINRTED